MNKHKTEQEVANAAYTINGGNALRLAAKFGVSLYCKNNDQFDARPVSLDEAVYVAETNADLIYAMVAPAGWSGPVEGRTLDQYFLNGEYLGADSHGVEPVWQDASPVSVIETVLRRLQLPGEVAAPVEVAANTHFTVQIKSKRDMGWDRVRIASALLGVGYRTGQAGRPVADEAGNLVETIRIFR